MGSSHHAEYDENLLASAPAPTKELLQVSNGLDEAAEQPAELFIGLELTFSRL